MAAAKAKETGKQIVAMLQKLFWGGIVAAIFALITVLASMFSEPSIGTLQASAEAKDYRTDNGFFGEDYAAPALMTPCVAADDFGYPRAYIFAKPYALGTTEFDTTSSLAESENYLLENVMSDVSGDYTGDALTSSDQIFFERENQAILWKDSGLVATGDPLIVRTEGSWTSWFNGQGISQTRACKLKRDPLSSLKGYTEDCPMDPEVVTTDEARKAIYMIANDTTNFNAACWFQSGYAAYALFTSVENKGDDASASSSTTTNNIFRVDGKANDSGDYADPNGGVTPGTTEDNLTEAQIAQMLYNVKGYPTLHLYGDLGQHTITNSTGATSDINLYGELYSPLPSGANAGDRIWVKIMDRYYEDNAGFYIAKFKQGAAVEKDGAIEQLITMVRDVIGQTAFRLYGAIVTNTGFQSAVAALLVLYATFMAVGFLIGWTKINQAELVMALLRVSVVLALISPNSWEFFYTYFFTFFLDGTYDLVNIVVGAATMGGGSSGSGPEYFDKILGLFFSPETGVKILSVFFVSGAGIVYLIMLYVVLLLLLYVTARLVIVVLMALIPIALLVIIAPIFLVFILFKFSNEYYKRWLQELFSNSLQTFLALAVLAFFSAVIIEFLQRTVGYRVCYRCIFCPVVDLKIFEPFALFGGDIIDPYHTTTGADVGLHAWLPDIRTDAYNAGITEGMYIQNQTGYDESYPGQLGYIWMDADPRHPGLELVYRNLIDMPFYDPVTEADLIAEKFEGDLVDFVDIFVLLIMSVLFALFVMQVPQIAMELATGSVMSLNLAAPALALWGAGARFAKWGADTTHLTSAVKTMGKIARQQTVGRLAHDLKAAGKTIGNKVTGGKYQTDRGKLEGAARHFKEEGNNTAFMGAMNALIAADVRALAKGGTVRDAGGNIVADMKDRKTAHHVFNREEFEKSVGDAINKYDQGMKAANANYELQSNPQKLADHVQQLKDQREDAIVRAVWANMKEGTGATNLIMNKEQFRGTDTKNAELRAEIRNALELRLAQRDGDKELGGKDYTPKDPTKAADGTPRKEIRGMAPVPPQEVKRNQERAGEIVKLRDDLAKQQEQFGVFQKATKEEGRPDWDREKDFRSDIETTASRLKALEAQQHNLQMGIKHDMERHAMGVKDATKEEISKRVNEEMEKAGLPGIGNEQKFGEEQLTRSEDLKSKLYKSPLTDEEKKKAKPLFDKKADATQPNPLDYLPLQQREPDKEEKKKIKKKRRIWDAEAGTWIEIDED
jgi:type IV secretory pathway VirB6-like protein